MGNNITLEIKKDLKTLKKLKESNPLEYKKRLKEFIEATKEFNMKTREFIDLVKDSKS